MKPEMVIRTVFFAAFVTMLTYFGFAVAGGRWSGTEWLMVALAHIACATIFVNFVFVFSYGYALSMVAVHLALMVLWPTPAGLLIGSLSAVYGLRLFAFCFARDRSAAYRPTRDSGAEADRKVPIGFRIFMWFSVSWLMTFAGMPAFRVAQSGAITTLVFTGALVMLIGLVLETVADQQKQATKSRNAGAFASSGLYTYIRHPNYLGEIVFHAGSIIAVSGGIVSGWAYLAAVIAPFYIMALMVYAAVDGDAKQLKRYGNDAAWREWRSRTGSLLPF